MWAAPRGGVLLAYALIRVRPVGPRPPLRSFGELGRPFGLSARFAKPRSSTFTSTFRVLRVFSVFPVFLSSHHGASSRRTAVGGGKWPQRPAASPASGRSSRDSQCTSRRSPVSRHCEPPRISGVSSCAPHGAFRCPRYIRSCASRSRCSGTGSRRSSAATRAQRG